jgi:hypothetical protein
MEAPMTIASRLKRWTPQSMKRRASDWAQVRPFGYRMKVRLLARRCDTFIISYPKAGRTWLRMMVGQALRRRFGFPRRKVMHATSARITRPGMPRILATHDDDPQVKPPELVFTDKQPYRRSKVILLVRDPRDLIVSYWHHRSKRNSGEFRFAGTLDEFIAEENWVVESLIAFYNAWARQRHVPAGFLLVRYEDLHRDPAQELRRVLEFLGLEDISEREVERAVRSSSFGRMRRWEEENSVGGAALRPGDPDDPDSFKVRQGGVGGHRCLLTHSQIAGLDRRLAALDPLYDDYR